MGRRSGDGQALIRDLLRRFAAVPLALAAYNAGPAPVAACGCVPPFPATRAYVAKILGLMGGAGEPLTAGSGLAVRPRTDFQRDHDCHLGRLVLCASPLLSLRKKSR